jgi:RNA polymerase sigma-70 factor, ECF subfamily
LSEPSRLSQLTDHSLLRKFRSGSEDAATTLYLRYADRLQRLANHQVSSELASRVDPEDIVQSVFRTFFRRAADGQYNIADKEDLWKLLLVMSLNKIRSSGTFHNAAKRSSRNTKSLINENDSRMDHPNEETPFQILKMTVEEIVRELPEEQHEIIFLRIQGFDIDEIAERSGRAKRSIERILQGFRKRLLKELGEPK